MTILDRLADHARERVAKDKEHCSLNEIREKALSLPKGNGDAFLKALSKEEMSFICEVKKASPSRGIIDPVFDYLSIAKEYEEAGADALSCLSEPKWFLGSDQIFAEIRGETKLPMLKKDFTVDEYQLYQARLLGADCVLLICALLPEDILRYYLSLCEELGLAALVETHDENEILLAVNAGAKLIGVNNRNLKDFSVDLSNATRLKERIPEGCLYVAESGVSAPEDVRALKKAGADAILIGEAMMRAENKKTFLRSLKEAAR